jgi:hypothetical protein
MTDELQIPRRRDGERKIQFNLNQQESQGDGVNNLEQVSLAAVIQILIKRGLCTEAELLAEENRQRSTNVSDVGLRTSDAYFTPVQTHSERERHRHRHADGNRLRRWAAQYSWSRKLGGLLFGWKWHRKKSEQKI